MQEGAFFLYLHLPLHFFLQKQFISSRHASDASGRSLHKGTKLSSNFSRPQFTGSKFRCCFRRPLDHFVTWWQDLSICFWRQLNIGGMFSRDRPPCVKGIRLAVLILFVQTVGLYRIIKKTFQFVQSRRQ